MPVTREQYKAAQLQIEEYEAQEGTEEAIIKRVINRGVREIVDFDWRSDDRVRIKKLRYVFETYLVIIEYTYLHPIDHDSFEAKSGKSVTLKIR